MGQVLLTAIETVTSDANGYWQCRSVPRDITGLSLALSHPKFFPVEYDEAVTGDPAEQTVSHQDLYAGKAILRMEPLVKKDAR